MRFLRIGITKVTEWSISSAARVVATLRDLKLLDIWYSISTRTRSNAESAGSASDSTAGRTSAST
jgi:hypothetical protein